VVEMAGCTARLLDSVEARLGPADTADTDGAPTHSV
jgi:hypothetical protein